MIAILKYKHNCSAKHFIELYFSHLFSELVSLLWRISLFTSQIDRPLYAKLYCMRGVWKQNEVNSILVLKEPMVQWRKQTMTTK